MAGCSRTKPSKLSSTSASKRCRQWHSRAPIYPPPFTTNFADIKKEIRAAGSKRISHATFTVAWPVFKDYEIEEVEGDLLVHAVIEPIREGVQGILRERWSALVSSADSQDQQARGVKRYIVPLTECPDLFLQFARLVPKKPVERDKGLEIVNAWVADYGVLGLVAADTERNPGRHESLRTFWEAALKASETLELYQAAMVEAPDQQLTTTLQT